ncbi:MAG: GerMN domain-containing protein [Clostridia bacterium]|nr:GerMN domain-containing protein [Clostridia bacterium]
MRSAACSCFRQLTALILAALLLTGCSAAMLQEPTVQSEAAASLRPQDLPLEPQISLDAVLYFPNQNRTKLVAEPRQLNLSQREPQAEAVVRALLEGPQAPELRPVGTGLVLDSVQVSTEVINVCLLSDPDVHLTNAELTAGKLAVATTLIDLTGVRGVNVLIDGVQTAFENPATGQSVPTGTLTRATDLTEEFNTLEQKAAALNPDLYATLYFLDPGDSYLLPEMRRVVFQGEQDMVATLVAQLQQGPDNTYSYHPVLDPAIVLLSHSLTENGDGTLTARLVFNRDPAAYIEDWGSGVRLALGALCCTICDFVPRVSVVEVRSRLSPLEGVVCRPEEYADLLGCRVQICLPNTPNGVTMTMVERVLPERSASDPRSILGAVFDGPVGLDSRDVWPAVPEGLSMENVLDVYAAGNVMVVNFDAETQQMLAKAAPEDERTMLFAIINTLTSLENVRRVLFLVDGKRQDYLGSRTVCILDPLMRNPGIIK